MGERRTLLEALDAGGAFEVWRLLDEETRRQAAVALWRDADRETRAPVEVALAKAIHFRPVAVRKLAPEKVAARLARLVKELPEPVVFQFLFHLHMAHRRPLLVAFLDAVGLPHEDGVLDLPEDAAAPDPDRVGEAARALLETHGRDALIYLATLWVADSEFWAGLGPVLAGFDEEGEPLEDAQSGE